MLPQSVQSRRQRSATGPDTPTPEFRLGGRNGDTRSDGYPLLGRRAHPAVMPARARRSLPSSPRESGAAYRHPRESQAHATVIPARARHRLPSSPRDAGIAHRHARESQAQPTVIPARVRHTPPSSPREPGTPTVIPAKGDLCVTPPVGDSVAELPSIPSGEPPPLDSRLRGNDGCLAGMTVVQRSPKAGIQGSGGAFVPPTLTTHNPNNCRDAALHALQLHHPVAAELGDVDAPLRVDAHAM